MPLYVTLSEGPRPDRQKVVLTTGDERVTRAVMDVLARIGESPTEDDSAPLRLADKPLEGLPHPYLLHSIEGGKVGGR